MNNILIIGSSHVGALKSGFDHIAIPSSLKIKYIALPAGLFRHITVSDNYLLYPKSDAGYIRKWFGFESCPCLDGFDKILFVADRCRLSLNLYSENRKIPTLSAPIVREIVKNIQSPLYSSLLNAIGPSKLIFLGAPLLSSAAYQEKHLKRVPLLDQDNLSEYCLADCIREVCHRTTEDDAMPSILLPPSHLLEKHQFNTLDTYIRGGLRVNGNARLDGHDADFNEDMEHGNAEYGKEIAAHILDHLVT